MAKQTFTTGQVLTAAQMTSLQQTAMGGGSPSVKTASYVLVAADAGTVIQMNSASSTTITINTALFAAGDSIQIQNIGAGVCTITAGTATVTTSGSLALSIWEGGYLYFTSASASIFFDYTQTGAVSPLTTKGDLWGYSTLDARIPIGTNNQVLTADSAQALGLKWATPSSGGMTLLSTTTLSGASTTISSIDQTYTNLVAVFYGMTNATADGGILIRPNGSSSISNHVITNSTTASLATSVTVQNSDMLVTYSSLISRTDANNAFVLTINNYANTTFYKPFNFYGQAYTGVYKYSIMSAGNIATNSGITSLYFQNNGGNWSTGTVLIYGVK